MPAGGKRPGAGRRPGSITKTSRQMAQEMIERQGGPPPAPTDATMLEIIEANARYFYAQAIDAEKALAAMQPEILAAMEPQEQYAHMLAEVKKAAGLRQLAGEAAKDAARYRHAPIGAVTPSDGRDKEFVPLPERIAEYNRRDAIEGSKGKVVELKGKR